MTIMTVGIPELLQPQVFEEETQKDDMVVHHLRVLKSELFHEKCPSRDCNFVFHPSFHPASSAAKLPLHVGGGGGGAGRDQAATIVKVT